MIFILKNINESSLILPTYIWLKSKQQQYSFLIYSLVFVKHLNNNWILLLNVKLINKNKILKKWIWKKKKKKFGFLVLLFYAILNNII